MIGKGPLGRGRRLPVEADYDDLIRPKSGLREGLFQFGNNLFLMRVSEGS